MPIRHTFRPHCIALAISLALGHTGSAIAQQPAATPPSPADQMVWIEAFIKDPDTVTTKVTKAESGPEGIALGDAHDLVTVSGRGRFNGLVDGGGGKNVLQLDVASSGELGETRNFNVLHIKRGQWTLTGTDDFRDGAVVMGNAALTNRGRIAGPVSIDKRATFRGNGHVGHLTVAGRLEVNALHGAPQVSGNLELHDSAELAYEVNADGRSETIKVDGTASLGDATLKIVAAPGDYPLTSKYRVIEAGKVQGQFGKVLNELAFMTPSLQYDDGKNVDLTYARNDVPIERLSITENGRELAQSIEEPTYIPQGQTSSVTAAAAQPSTPLNAAVTALLGSSKTTATYAIEQLAGGSNANLANATLSSVSPVSTSILSAMRQLDSADLIGQNGTSRLAADSEVNGRVWLQALGNSGTLDRGQGSSALQHSTKGLVLGADWALDEQWRVGVIGGQSQTRLDASQLDGDLDSWHLGAYALRQSGPLALRLGATYGSHDGSTQRRVAFNGFSDRPKGSYDASTQQAFTEVGYNLGSGNLSAEPFANLGYQRYQRDSYTEKGGAAALQVHGQAQSNFSSTFGLRLVQLNTLDNGMQLTPRFSAGWKHTYGDVDSRTDQRLANGGKNYTVQGAALDRDSLMLDAGLELAVSTRHTFGVGYNGEISNDSRSHGVMGQWRMAF